MLSKSTSLENAETTSEEELERLHRKLIKLETNIYRRRLAHVKSLRKHITFIQREIENGFHSAYQVYEVDMHNLAITVREFQEDIANLLSIAPEELPYQEPFDMSYQSQDEKI